MLFVRHIGMPSDRLLACLSDVGTAKGVGSRDNNGHRQLVETHGTIEINEAALREIHEALHWVLPLKGRVERGGRREGGADSRFGGFSGVGVILMRSGGLSSWSSFASLWKHLEL